MIMFVKMYCKEGDPRCYGCAEIKPKSDKVWMVATIALILLALGVWMFFGWRYGEAADAQILSEQVHG